MFREMRRAKRQLGKDECVEILLNEWRGILSVYGEDGYPYGLPMNFYYDKESEKLYFHSAMKGHKIDALMRDNRVSFCVYDKGFRKEGDWALNIKSVIIFGKIKYVEDESLREEIMRKFGLKFDPDPQNVEDTIKRMLRVTKVMELSIDHMSGKLCNES